MLSFNDFVKVFDAYGKYVSQASQAPQASQASDDISQMLTRMQAQLNQMQTPAPAISDVKPVSVDDVIAKIFE